MKKNKQSIAGFSLVEVTIALGIVAFCFVIIMGLLAVGANSTHSSTVQTAATDVLTAIASDIEATPNIAPIANTPSNVAKGSQSETSLIYGITLPKSASGPSSSPQTVYIGENGKVVSAATAALYQLNVWTTTYKATSTATQQETFVRLLLTWPAVTTYASAPNYVESVIAVNRT